MSEKVDLNRKYVSAGSFIVVEVCETCEETVIGKVAFTNFGKNYEIGDMVLYHISDTKEVIIDGNLYHAIYYYNIALKIKIPEKKIEPPKDEGSSVKFNGMSADF